MEDFVKNIYMYKPETKEMCFLNFILYHTAYL